MWLTHFTPYEHVKLMLEVSKQMTISKLKIIKIVQKEHAVFSDWSSSLNGTYSGPVLLSTSAKNVNYFQLNINR